MLRLLIGAAVAVIAVSSGRPATGDGPLWGYRAAGPAAHARASAQTTAQLPPHYSAQSQFPAQPGFAVQPGRHYGTAPQRQVPYTHPFFDIYPRYYGGFHARHLQEIGVPTGDRDRMRGLPW